MNTYHCSLYAIQGVDVPKVDLGPFKTMSELVRTTGKSYDQWKRDQVEVKKITSVRAPRQRRAGITLAALFADF
jgi:hypothetical protein